MKFVIYTSNWCSYCDAAKQILSSKGFEFSEINLEEKGMDREDLFELTGGRTVPQILMNEKPIGGFNELQKLHVSGELRGNSNLTK